MARRNTELCRRCEKIRNGISIQAKRNRANARRATGNRYAHVQAYSERNEVLRNMGFKSYTEYLDSNRWKSIRSKVLGGNPNCCKCDAIATQVHHSRYTNANLVGISLEYLHAVCRDCHEHAEFDQNKKKLSLKQANIRLGIDKPKTSLRKNHKHWRGPSKTTVKRRPITNESGFNPGRSRETESASDLQLG
jgi:hypothetical protein